MNLKEFLKQRTDSTMGGDLLLVGCQLVLGAMYFNELWKHHKTRCKEIELIDENQKLRIENIGLEVKNTCKDMKIKDLEYKNKEQ